MALVELELIVVLIVAFVPAALYLMWIRRAEVYEREPVGAIAGTFIYGLFIALGLAFLLELLALTVLEVYTDGGLDPTVESIILAVVLAPVIEEFTKLTGVMASSRRLTELENGLVYGAAVGLGFAAGENVMYYTSSLAEGVELFIITVLARTITSTSIECVPERRPGLCGSERRSPLSRCPSSTRPRTWRLPKRQPSSSSPNPLWLCSSISTKERISPLRGLFLC